MCAAGSGSGQRGYVRQAQLAAILKRVGTAGAECRQRRKGAGDCRRVVPRCHQYEFADDFSRFINGSDGRVAVADADAPTNIIRGHRLLICDLFEYRLSTRVTIYSNGRSG